jgi:hypothetical protein
MSKTSEIERAFQASDFTVREAINAQRNSPRGILNLTGELMREVSDALDAELSEQSARYLADATARLQTGLARTAELYGAGQTFGAELREEAAETLERGGGLLVVATEQLAELSVGGPAVLELAGAGVEWARAAAARTDTALAALERADVSPSMSWWARIMRLFSPTALITDVADGVLGVFGLGSEQTASQRTWGLVRLALLVAAAGGGGYLLLQSGKTAATVGANVFNAQMGLAKEALPALLPLATGRIR